MYKSVISILALMSFASCAMDHEIMSKEQERKPIALTSVTKGANGEPNTTQFVGGDVWLWAKKSDGTEYIKAWQLSADENGSFTSVNDTEYYYWPSDGLSLTFYALHGHFTNSTEISEGTPSWADLTSLTHTVESDQSTDNARFTSDLLYAETGEVEPNSTGLLTFDHLLAKIIVKLDLSGSEGITAEELANATVTLTYIQPEAYFSSTSESTTTGGTRQPIKTFVFPSESSNIDISSKSFDAGSAIVPPQTFGNNENANIIQITLSDGRIFSYTPNAIELQQGLEYTFTLKIINSVLSVSSITVSPFTENSENMSWDIYIGEINASGINVNEIEETEDNKSFDNYVDSSE